MKTPKYAHEKTYTYCGECKAVEPYHYYTCSKSCGWKPAKGLVKTSSEKA